MKALMHDMTCCIGCRGCQVSCKQWNDLPANPPGEFFQGPGYQNPADLDARTYTLITYNEVQQNGRFNWVFGKLQCKHCLEPACAAICPVDAIHKNEMGVVHVDRETCIACQLCATVCPFNVPKFAEEDGKMHKCWLCLDKLEAGQVSACAKTCAPGAIFMGERDDVLKEAKRRISAGAGKYINHIYGAEEAGGCCVFHISDVPFNLLGFPDVPKEVIQVSKAEIFDTLQHLNPATIAASVFVAGIGWVVKRRNELSKV